MPLLSSLTRSCIGSARAELGLQALVVKIRLPKIATNVPFSMSIPGNLNNWNRERDWLSICCKSGASKKPCPLISGKLFPPFVAYGFCDKNRVGASKSASSLRVSFKGESPLVQCQQGGSERKATPAGWVDERSSLSLPSSCSSIGELLLMRPRSGHPTSRPDSGSVPGNQIASLGRICRRSYEAWRIPLFRRVLSLGLARTHALQ